MADVSDYRRWAKEHPNFMTPHILSVKQRDDFFVELSEGTGFEHEPLYGVSVIHSLRENSSLGVVEFETLARYEEAEGLSNSFRDKAKAQAHQDNILKAISACGGEKTIKSELSEITKEFVACLKRKIEE